MNVPIRQSRRSVILLLAFYCFALSGPAVARDAEIVSLVGKGDTRVSVGQDWLPATVSEKLAQGSFVRTRDYSQMALLLQDQTQLRLNQDSMVQIKDVSPAGGTTRLVLTRGRIWAQAKRKKYVSDQSGPPAVTVQTPNATAAIRGTDWQLVVDRNGVSTLTVFSGAVEFYNHWGRVWVHPSEQARAVKGKAPTKILLTNARERVQWVTAYRPEPRRWLPQPPSNLLPAVQAIEQADYAHAIPLLQARIDASNDADAALLLADLDISLGKLPAAVRLLEAHRDVANAAALLARADLIADHPKKAEQVLAAAEKRWPDNAEILLAEGELARFNGNIAEAKAAYRKVLTIDERNSNAWYGLGRIATEQEAVRTGRRTLDRAIALKPTGAGYQGQLGTLASYANQFTTAQQAFGKALKQKPDDYVALTGLGILQLKQGHPDAALNSFLKVGVIEPHYARGALYTGVAYYQLGNYPRAMEMFRRAAAIDPNDPMPYMMMSLAASDRLDMGDAVAAARQAEKRMPYLKSANQLMDDQKGNANIGASLAQFGMEDWAQAYAHDSYNPYWAGSHLFLADRYSGNFNKNSELFMGFLTDPSVFGYPNRFNPLIAKPGNYATAGGTLSHQDSRQRGLKLIANGYNVSKVPLSYYLEADPTLVRPGSSDIHMDGEDYTIGLGMLPSPELSLFLFGDKYHVQSDMELPGSNGYSLALTERISRIDGGGSFKFSPTSELWIKAGTGTDDTTANGVWGPAFYGDTVNSYVDDYLGSTYCETLPCYSSTYANTFNRTRQSGIQLRHTFDLNPNWQLSWGAEEGRQSKPSEITLQVPPAPLVAALPTYSADNTGSEETKSVEFYLSNKIKLSDSLQLQADLSHMHLTDRSHNVLGINFSLLGPFEPQVSAAESAHNGWNPGIGLAWQPSRGETLRFALQQWQRPADVNTLAPVDMAGIPVDDRMVALGGKMQRARAQFEWEVNSATFIEGYLDAERVHNLSNSTSLNSLISDSDLAELKRLLNSHRFQPEANDLWEATPQFGEADVETAGLDVDRQLSHDLAGSLRYRADYSRNTGSGFESNRVPWLPRQLLNLNVDWFPGSGWALGWTATYRSQRYVDEANTQSLDAGWNMGLRGYWQSADKHWALAAIADNLHADKSSAQIHASLLEAQALYRF